VLALLVALALTTSTLAGESRPEDRWVYDHLPKVVELYQVLHSHPELSGREVNTAKLMAEELRQAGAQVTQGVGRLGVVGVLRNGNGPTVLVRAEMDALPVTEATGAPYASTVTAENDTGLRAGVMHACGHDVHMASLVGTARWLADHKDRWSGTVVLIAQPAEESAGGARWMLADGLYTRFPRPDYALALHVAHDLEAGKVGYHAGPAMAGTTAVTVTVKGRGGHGALPHTTVDPVVLASALVLDLQTIVSRENNPLDPAVVTIGSIQGGNESNIIPEAVKLRLTVRTFRPEVRELILAGIRRRASALAVGHEAPAPVVDVGGGVPPLVNEPRLVAKVVPALEAELGGPNVDEVEPEMTAEDFGLFGQGNVPTFMFRLGTVSPDRLAKAESGSEPLPSLHSPRFCPDPAPTLRTGVRAMTAAVVALLPPTAGNRPAVARQ
jgi:hippurate hydrolase